MQRFLENIWQGLGSLINIGGSNDLLKKYHHRTAEDDMRDDWATTGRDIRNAMQGL